MCLLLLREGRRRPEVDVQTLQFVQCNPEDGMSLTFERDRRQRNIVLHTLLLKPMHSLTLDTAIHRRGRVGVLRSIALQLLLEWAAATRQDPV